MRMRIFRRGAAAALLVALVVPSLQASQADEWYPGLPDTTFGEWSNASQSGMSYATRAQQWFRSPMGMTVAEVQFGQDGPDQLWIRAAGYVVSPEGAPENYGYLEPMVVRSVGFGMIPVEATVQVSQRRVDGYPTPIDVMLRYHPIRYPGTTRVDRVFQETVIEDAFDVRILGVKVDGVDLELNGDCRTVEPAPVALRGPGYRIDNVDSISPDEWYRAADPSTYYHPLRGGQLTGTLTIPPFTGCTTTAGDDLSDLLTLSASGPDNPIMARNGWPCYIPAGGASAPLPPGTSSPRLATRLGARSDRVDHCVGTKPFDYPTRGGD